MEPEHSKQGRTRGSTALSGQKTRLLAMALLLAVVAGAGLAIGEEKDVSEQANQQDAVPKVIQLDGPIQPSAIITKDGVIIPEYDDETDTGAKKQSGKEERNKTPEIGDVVPSLGVTFGEEHRKKPAEEFIKVLNKDGSVTMLPPFTKEFQMEDARKLEDEFKVIIPEHPIDFKAIDEDESNMGSGGAYIAGMGFIFPPVTPKWKSLGVRTIAGKQWAIWQMAVVVGNARGFGFSFKKLDLVGYNRLIVYGLHSKSWINQKSVYVFQRTKGYKSTIEFGGNTVILEYHTRDINRIPKINEHVIFNQIRIPRPGFGTFSSLNLTLKSRRYCTVSSDARQAAQSQDIT